MSGITFHNKQISVNQMTMNSKKWKRISKYSEDLNSELVWYSDHGISSLVKWFTIQIPGTMVRGILIVNHLDNKQEKVCYLDVSAIQMFAIQVPTIHRGSDQWRKES